MAFRFSIKAYNSTRKFPVRFSQSFIFKGSMQTYRAKKEKRLFNSPLNKTNDMIIDWLECRVGLFFKQRFAWKTRPIQTIIHVNFLSYTAYISVRTKGQSYIVHIFKISNWNTYITSNSDSLIINNKNLNN